MLRNNSLSVLDTPKLTFLTFNSLSFYRPANYLTSMHRCLSYALMCKRQENLMGEKTRNNSWRVVDTSQVTFLNFNSITLFHLLTLDIPSDSYSLCASMCQNKMELMGENPRKNSWREFLNDFGWWQTTSLISGNNQVTGLILTQRLVQSDEMLSAESQDMVSNRGSVARVGVSNFSMPFFRAAWRPARWLSLQCCWISQI